MKEIFNALNAVMDIFYIPMVILLNVNNKLIAELPMTFMNLVWYMKMLKNVWYVKKTISNIMAVMIRKLVHR